MKKKICKNCKWCGKIFHSRPGELANKAYCFRLPPVRGLNQQERAFVYADRDFCGEFKSKPKKV